MQTKEQARQCAQATVNDSSVKAVLAGPTQVGADAIHQTINGKLPYFTAVPLTTSDLTAQNSFALGSGAFGSSPGFVYYVTKVVHANKVALVYPTDDPAAVGATGARLRARSAAPAPFSW